MTNIYVYDDTDPAFIYQPLDAWDGGTWNATNTNQSGTMHFSGDLSAMVTFTFPIPAVGFSYFGIKRSSGGLYEICVDCNPGAPNLITVDGLNLTDDGHNPPVSLYNQTFPTLGIHQITIKNIADSRGTSPGSSQIIIDRIELTISSIPSVITSTFTVSITPTSSTSPSGSTASISSSPPVGPIIGGVVGALALIIGVTIFLYCRRLRRANMHNVEEPSARSDLSEEPSILDITKSHNRPTVLISPVMSPTAIPRERYGPPVPAGSETENPALRNMNQLTMLSIAPIATPTTSTSVPGVTSSTNIPVPRIQQYERDSGPLLSSINMAEEIPPPEYEQVFLQPT